MKFLKMEATCQICFDKAIHFANPDCCSHSFCFSCLRKWTFQNQTCPQCRKSFRLIKHNFFLFNTEELYCRFYLQPKAPHPEIIVTPYLEYLNKVLRAGRYTVENNFGRNDPDYQTAVNKPGWFNPFQVAENCVDLFAEISNTGINKRAKIYEYGQWVVPLFNSEITEGFWGGTHKYGNDEKETRVYSWLCREILACARVGTERRGKALMFDVIMHVLRVVDLSHAEIRNMCEIILGDRADHFIHEVKSFVLSGFNMDDYDRKLEEWDRYDYSYREITTTDTTELAILEPRKVAKLLVSQTDETEDHIFGFRNPYRPESQAIDSALNSVQPLLGSPISSLDLSIISDDDDILDTDDQICSENFIAPRRIPVHPQL